MKKVKNFKDLKAGIQYTNTNQDILYFFAITNKGKTAIFIKEMVDENQEKPYYCQASLNKNEIKALRYDI